VEATKNVPSRGAVLVHLLLRSDPVQGAEAQDVLELRKRKKAAIMPRTETGILAPGPDLDPVHVLDPDPVQEALRMTAIKHRRSKKLKIVPKPVV